MNKDNKKNYIYKSINNKLRQYLYKKFDVGIYLHPKFKLKFKA